MRDNPMDRQRKHHTFLFRHCVRSTKDKVKLYNGVKDASNHAKDYTDKKIPMWNTPEEWCTETAIEIMQNTGAFLLEHILMGHGPPTKRIKVQFISDTAQRDVDTSLALSLGMLEASWKYPSLQIDGLSNIHFDHILFEPLDVDKAIHTPRCAAWFSTNQTADDIEQRLAKVPPPKGGLVKILDLLESLGGVGSEGTLRSIKPAADMYLNRTELRLAGAINIVKLFGQMMFYSRAGGVNHPFLKKATVDDIYQVLEWVSWSRSVLSIDNVEVATQGAVVANAILQSLNDGLYGGEYCADSYDVCATIFVGHDSTIDAVATALGLRWKLSPPYQSGEDRIGEYVPTPPGGAMHFIHDKQSDTMDLSYLYPVYITGHKTDWTLNITGILESVPMNLTHPMDGQISLSSSGTATQVSSSDSILNAMEKRMHSILDEYPGAIHCYMDILEKNKASLYPVKLPYEHWREPFDLVIGCTVVLAFILLLFGMLLIVKKRIASAGGENYELTESAEHIEFV